MKWTYVKSRPFSAAAAAMMLMASRAGGASDKQVRVELFVMSKCPYGVQAENGLIPSAQSLADSVDLGLFFIASELPAVEGSTDTKPVFSSMHGKGEVEEDIRQLCMQRHYPKTYLTYILERNKSVRDPNWRAASAKASASAEKIEACVSGDEGAALLSKNAKEGTARNVNSSPTIFIDGKPYSGGRGQRSLTLALCAALKAKGVPEAEACRLAAAMPADPAESTGGCDADGNPAARAEPVAFDIWVVTDGRCKACEPTLMDVLKARHPAASIKTLDAESPEGRDLIARHRSRSLPLYVLDKKVEKDPGFAALQDSMYAKSAGQYVIRARPESFIPCVRLDRDRKPSHLDVFISPFSSFAAQAETELVRFLAESDLKDLTFSMHFIVSESVRLDAKSPPQSSSDETRSASLREISDVSSDLTSSGGEAELRESLRQVCLFQHSTIGNYFTYLACRNSSPRDESMGNACLKPNDAVRKCAAGAEGRMLLRKDARLVKDLSINTSIAILWENRYGPFGWHDVDWKNLISGRAK